MYHVTHLGMGFSSYGSSCFFPFFAFFCYTHTTVTEDNGVCIVPIYSCSTWQNLPMAIQCLKCNLPPLLREGESKKKGISADTKSPPFFLFCSSLVESRRDLGSQPIKGSSAMHLQGSVNYKAVTSTSAVSNRMIE